MDFMLDMDYEGPGKKIGYRDPVMFIGSCFTEHIGNYMGELKFDVLQNPNGILFDPYSVAHSLVSYVQNKRCNGEDLFFLNELWQSWQHHGIFSNTDKSECLKAINASQQTAHSFLKKAKWIIVTLGSSFSYRLLENGNRLAVANCHRAPAQWFNKQMMAVEEISAVLDNCIHQLFRFNAEINIVLTVSPVRHIRDGVMENNRSKARLIEVVHHLADKFEKIYYFPAYELVIDVLRDYRFYDVDMVHPNYQATNFVLQNFVTNFIDPQSREIMEEVKKIMMAKKHKPLHPSTIAHKNFLKNNLEKAARLQVQYPFIDLADEISYFSGLSV
ncbi:MAG: GSCFA domain-containing protein [Bacteroidetes bacterium]|nr:GSCFA domain-containing protein [Bacteroidota bacterium]MBS1974704.1 GSCFA domain-containing protein [Bacteroidota bacterium]